MPGGETWRGGTEYDDDTRVRGDRSDGAVVSLAPLHRIVGKLHPQVPKSVEIKEALGRLTPEERQYILVRARMLANYSKAVEEAVVGTK